VAGDLSLYNEYDGTFEDENKTMAVARAIGGVPLTEEEINKVGITDANGFPFLFAAMARRERRADPGLLDE
jgi:hypothetical protein